MELRSIDSGFSNLRIECLNAAVQQSELCGDVITRSALGNVVACQFSRYSNMPWVARKFCNALRQCSVWFQDAEPAARTKNKDAEKTHVSLRRGAERTLPLISTGGPVTCFIRPNPADRSEVLPEPVSPTTAIRLPWGTSSWTPFKLGGASSSQAKSPWILMAVPPAHVNQSRTESGDARLLVHNRQSLHSHSDRKARRKVLM